jgi:hypothetical protein
MSAIDRYASDSQITAASPEALEALRDAVAIREQASAAKTWLVTRLPGEKHFSSGVTCENSDGDWSSTKLNIDVS